MLHGKGALRLLISWPWDGEIRLDYPGGTNIITKVLKSERGSQEVWKDIPWAKECAEPRSYEMAGNRFFPRALLDFSPFQTYNFHILRYYICVFKPLVNGNLLQ